MQYDKSSRPYEEKYIKLKIDTKPIPEVKLYLTMQTKWCKI